MQNIPNKTNGKHQLWIDILKGMGILSIIYAHTTDHKGVFIYAVPLFFILWTILNFSLKRACKECLFLILHSFYSSHFIM